ncbi:unnamed protein product [Brassica oleracea var. botrytis]
MQINDNKIGKEILTHAFRLNNARQTFLILFIPNWTYSPSGYQTSLDEDLQLLWKNKQIHQPFQEYPPEYFQDSRLPDDSMNIDEIRKMFNIEVHDNPKEPEEDYTCPDDHYGCCDKHIIEFEIDH